MAPATCKDIVAPLSSEWESATRTHPFLKDVNAGRITEARFNTWLAQDYKYVRCFVRLLASMLVKCPESHLETLVGGMAAIDAEIKWFQEKAKERGIPLGETSMQPACAEYAGFLKSLMTQPYAVQAAAFWAMEACYNQSWTGVGEGLADANYQEFVNRWGNLGFVEYCVALQAQADEALAAASEEERAAADAAVRKVVALELDFWNMAYH